MASSLSKISVIGKGGHGEYQIRVNGEYEFFGVNMHLHQRRQLVDSLRPSVEFGNSLIGRFLSFIGLEEKGGPLDSMAELNKYVAKEFTPLEGRELSVYIWDEGDLEDHHVAVLNSFFENWLVYRAMIRSDAYKFFNMMKDQADKSSLEKDFIYSSILHEEDIDDYFCISSLEVNDEEVTELSGACLWEEEHGYVVETTGLDA